MQNLIVLPVAIQVLAEYCTAKGHLATSAGGTQRLSEGIAAHKKLQKQYMSKEDMQYQKEVSLTFDCIREHYILRLSGRADGIFITDDEKTIVHEIKSTYIPCSLILEPQSLSHLAQMKIYAYIYAVQNNLSSIGMRLTYFSLEEEKEHSFCFEAGMEELTCEFEAFIEDYCLLADLCVQHKKELINSSEKLQFPFENYRSFQREAAAQVYTCVKEGNTLFLEAPTGTGKTIATLFPAIKALGNNLCEKIFYLAAKNQTLLVAADALELMRQNGLSIKSIVITAKEKSCMLKTVDCDAELCPYAADYFTKLHSALPEIGKNNNFNYSDIIAFAEKYQLCPYELSLSLAEICDVVICDYNYLFDPQAKLKRFFTLGGQYAFLIDEAHNLVERSREMFSATLTKEQILSMRALCRPMPKLFKALSKLNTAMNALAAQKDEPYLILNEPPKEILHCVENILSKIEEYAFAGQPLPKDAVLGLKDLLRYVKISEQYSNEYYTTYCEGEKNCFSIQLFCLQPSPFIRDALNKGNSAVLFSATLSPYCFYFSMLGGDESTYSYSLPSPFESENLLVCADYSIDTTYAARAASYAAIASRIYCACKTKKGNFMAYFPSFEFMNNVLAHFYQLEFDGKVLVHSSGFNKTQREEFLDQFIIEQEATLIGFTVMGSHFGEGIDLVGEALIGVIIVGVGLPMVNFQRQLLKEYFDETLDSGFDYAYTYPGMNKVLQAGGRVIRTHTDKGFILLLDRRFSREQYSALLPAHWHVNRVKNEHHLTEMLKEFWSENI